MVMAKYTLICEISNKSWCIYSARLNTNIDFGAFPFNEDFGRL